MSELFHEIFGSLAKGDELVLVTVIGDSGSTPRTSGSDMVVYGDGAISGTIGGGIVEGDVIRSALKLFGSGGAVISSYDLVQTGRADDMDLVCGGKMKILIEHLSAHEANVEMFRLMCEEMKMCRPFFWVGKLVEISGRKEVERAVQTSDSTWAGSLSRDIELQTILGGINIHRDKTSLFETEKQQYVVAPVLPPYTVYLMGAGHVSKEIAVLARQVGFRILVFDDRADFANPARFPDVDGVFVCRGFASVFEEYSVAPGSYIVIVTRGHRFDKEVLAQALRTDAGYIGMIGSRRKKESVYQTLLREGFSQSDLDRVHCPIGLEIDAETPAEIGVSVIAQLIQHRASRRNR
jgi:xanthine dehydrogenase accessory factor